MIAYTVRPISDRTLFTGKHRHSAFESTWSRTLTLLDHELRQIKGRDVVLEMDVEERHIRLDGQVRADARPASPAVRLAFESTHGPLTYGTDAFWAWQDNVRAIALGLEALRKVDRYGITKRGEQYAGFKALPAGRAMPASHMTSEAAWAVLADLLGAFDGAKARDDLPAQLRRARALAHPDRHGGDRELWDKVEAAREVLL